MKIIKNAFIYSLLFMQLICCGQNTNTNKDMTNNITSDNIAAKVMENVKRYPQEPMYMLRINQNYCTYEILVNDYPVENNYDLGAFATPIYINEAILKSGGQTVTVRMYPIGDLLQKAYGEDKPFFKNLEGGSSVSIEVIKVNDWKNYQMKDEQTIMVHQSPGFEDNKLPAAGSPFYEYTFSFNAQVPYENEGWSKGVDLRKLDQNKLKQKVLAYYKNVQKIFEDEDADAKAQAEFGQLLRRAQSNYWDVKYTQETWDEYKESLKFKDKTFQPIENYEVQFYGNGRIIYFKFPSSPNTDRFLRGKSVLYFEYPTENGKIRGEFPRTYLYMPQDYKGQEEIHLEMIK
ncbi:hypothetical protein [Frigoriflavimonas asaccharolytica]|uniref:Uncharacterized protein n=1 Tax=Frigoriflavimonas asaccharolytica TaxID=2735899 RepID=A0A8J8G9A1_9FLAO|nr:hypothetical protein [Frigoriflavimonas asaccharolytica]NRS92307.1 hypothetical protein [Frigoriflavimonas asaccharolytica]